MNIVYNILIACVCALINFNAQAQVITTIAGNGINGLPTEGLPATATTLSNTQLLVFDKFNNIYFTDMFAEKVYKIDTAGIIRTYAGTGMLGFSGDGGAATVATFKFPDALACDTFGNLYIGDKMNHRIRKVDINTGIISTFAGKDCLVGPCDSGNGGQATAATFNPYDIAFDKYGNMYIADNVVSKIRKINTDGTITTFAGIGGYGFSPDGINATAAMLNTPSQMVFDEANNMFFVDGGNKRIRKIDTLGILTTIAGTGISSFNGDNIPALTAQIKPLCMSYFNGKLYFTDDTNQRIRVINELNIVSTLAGTGIAGFNGDGIQATDAQINQPGGIINDINGSIYFGDVWNYRIRKISSIDTVRLTTNKISSTVNSITLTPNPAQSKLLLQSNAEITNIVITNMLGQTMLNKECKNEKMELDIENFKQGVYFVLVNNRWRGKFVKE